ncbi:hypothetical protein GCM10007116_17750 [Sulfodiicoccus acidiphilus]|uniref:Uncharacterized protein n=1 Tax=Sulfodiicoccus acidiphilus TaxID=1670455 RepID=A0A830H1M6_9CREN|nr:hypothetical protein GCM10007116_17750 [Sulfodiicoccus acidiphilus]
MLDYYHHFRGYSQIVGAMGEFVFSLMDSERRGSASPRPTPCSSWSTGGFSRSGWSEPYGVFSCGKREIFGHYEDY